MSRNSVYLIAMAGIMGFLPTGARAQTVPAPTAPHENQIYCSGISTIRPVHYDTYVVSGQESDVKIVFAQGDKVFVNKGARQGVKVGDQFSVSRVEEDYVPYPWFKEQQDLTHMMGTFIADIGRLRVIAVQDRTSIAEITLACDTMQRGDGVEPFVERPAPSFKSSKLDLYAAPSDKAKGTIVFSNGFGQLMGVGNIIYVDIGGLRGLKVGDYLRVYRFQGEHDETVYNVPGTAYKEFGLGSTPEPYGWKDLPRDVLGEGMVLRVSPTSAAVLLTDAQHQIFAGDFVEIE